MLLLLWPRPPVDMGIAYYFHQDTDGSTYLRSDQQDTPAYTIQDRLPERAYRRRNRVSDSS